MSNDVNTPLVLHGAREVLARTGGGAHIDAQVEALERAARERSPLAFDLAKTLVETVCKTILNDRGRGMPGTPDVPELLRETLLCLDLLPEGHQDTAGGRGRLEKVARGLEQAVQGLAELRNTEGLASHGRDAYASQMDSVQVDLAVRSADALVNFLYMTHYTYFDRPTRARLRYDDNPDFNEYCDTSHEDVVIFGLTFRASEMLFNTDIEAYRSNLAEFQSMESDYDDN